MKKIGRQAVGVGCGILVAAVVAIFAYGLHLLIFHLFPSLAMEGVPWPSWLTLIVLPEIIFIAGIVALWRKRRATAVGILIPAVVLAAHFAVHVVRHWTG